MKKSTLLVTISLFTLFLTLPILARAQGPTQLKSLTIKLWPEYDDPRLLVIIDGELDTPGSEIRLPIPDDAELNAVASSDNSGRLLKNDWTEEKGDDGQRLLVMTPANPVFRVEYYTPFPKDGDKRTINFELPAGYLATDFATLEVLLPPTSTDIVLTPPADETNEEGGVHIFQRTLGKIGDEPLMQKVEYINPDDALTAPRPTPAPPQSNPTNSQTTGTDAQSDTDSSLNPWIIILGAAAALLIVGGVVGLWLTREKDEVEPPPPPQHTRRKGKRSRIVSAPKTKNLDRYCRQCGKEFGHDDRFCRYCGAPRQSL